MVVLPKIIKWIDLETLEAGGYEEAPWDDWHRDILIKTLVENKYIICGDTHQQLAIPVFNDGYVMLSMRKWADLMDDAAMVIDPYAYAKAIPYNTFYMACMCKLEERLPQ